MRNNSLVMGTFVLIILTLAAVSVAFGFHFPDHSPASMLMAAAPAAGAATFDDIRVIAERFRGVVDDFNASAGEIRSQLAEQRERINGIAQQVAARPGHPGGGGSIGNSIGAAVSRHPNFSSLGPLASQRGKTTLSVKAMITSAPDSGGALAPPDIRVRDGVLLPRQRLIVRNMINGGQTNSGLVEYPKQTLRDLNADVVSEGARKPESNIAFELADAPVRTIAHWTKVAKQILADAPLLSSWLDSDLRYGVALKEERELLFGDGTGQHLYGIVPQATPYEDARNRASDNRYDTLSHAIAQAQVALLPATGIVLNDDDLEQLRVIKDEEGRYIGGGPFGPPITSIWGRPVVGTPEMPEGEFLVGAFFDGAQVLDREEVHVMISTENEDDFVRNLATVLCEERIALAVKRPQAFIHGEFPQISG